jgi:hypothetical protein
MKNASPLIPFLALAAVANAQIFLDFENGTASANPFTDNFRVVRNPAFVGQTNPADGSEPNNDYLFGRKTREHSTSSSVTAIYDTTPGNANDAAQTFADSFTVSFDISTSAYNSGVGIYLVDPANPSRNLFARFYFRDADKASGNNTAENRIILSKDAGLAAGSGGTRYTTATGLSGTGGYWHVATESYRAATAVVPSTEADPVWHSITLTYTPGDNNDTTLTVGYGTSFTATVVLSNADRIENPSLGFFINHPAATWGTTTKIDNLVITTIPEPSSYALLLQ